MARSPLMFVYLTTCTTRYAQGESYPGRIWSMSPYLRKLLSSKLLTESHHLASPHPSNRFGAAATGQLCTSPCSSDVPDTVGAWEFGRARRCHLLCRCCCLELCACRLELGRPVFGRGWELGHAHRTGPFFPCRLVARSPAKALGGSSGRGELDHCFAHCRALCVVVRAANAKYTQRGSPHPSLYTNAYQ